MKLHEWRQAQGLTRAEFGRRLGVRSKSTVGRWESGERLPARRHMLAIIAITGGAVTANDFVVTSPPAGAAPAKVAA